MTASEHTLIRDDRGHHLNGWWKGRALCSCTWLSDPLPSTEARREAWAQHVKEEA